MINYLDGLKNRVFSFKDVLTERLSSIRDAGKASSNGFRRLSARIAEDSRIGFAAFVVNTVVVGKLICMLEAKYNLHYTAYSRAGYFGTKNIRTFSFSALLAVALFASSEGLNQLIASPVSRKTRAILSVACLFGRIIYEVAPDIKRSIIEERNRKNGGLHTISSSLDDEKSSSNERTQGQEEGAAISDLPPNTTLKDSSAVDSANGPREEATTPTQEFNPQYKCKKKVGLYRVESAHSSLPANSPLSVLSVTPKKQKCSEEDFPPQLSQGILATATGLIFGVHTPSPKK